MGGRSRSREPVRHKPGTAAAPRDLPGAMARPRIFPSWRHETPERVGRYRGQRANSVDDHRGGQLDLAAPGTPGQETPLQRPRAAALRTREDERGVLAR